MKNTFVLGFRTPMGECLHKLSDNEIIDIKMWLKIPHAEDNINTTYDIYSFYKDNFVSKYEDKIKKYAEGVVIPKDVYKTVHNSLFTYIDQRTRLWKKYPSRDFHYEINIFNLMFSFLYSVFVKEKIELALFSSVPHMGVSYLAYKICKALNIKTIIFNQSIFDKKLFYMEDIEDMGLFSYMKDQGRNEQFCLEAHKDNLFYFNYTKEDNSFKNLIKQGFLRFQHKNTEPPRRILKKFIAAFCREKLPFSKFSVNQDYFYLKKLKKALCEADYTKKYVYFPLHYQPEMTTSAVGGMFCDQLLAIEYISKLIPADWFIYVKTHPLQGSYMRDDSFFVRLQQIKQAKLISSTENTHTLIANAQFVSTITGTVGWEAIQKGIPCLAFGYAWYRNLEGAFYFDENITFEKIHNYQINLKKLERDVEIMFNKMSACYIDQVYVLNSKDYDAKANTETLVQLITGLIH